MKVTASKNHLSYELRPKDIESIVPDSLDSYYQNFAQGLLKLSSEDYLKIYYNQGKIFVDTSDGDFSFSGIESNTCPNLLKRLIGRDVPLDSVLNQGDHLKIGGKYLRFIRLTDFPNEISSQGHFNDVGRYFMTIKKIPSAKACTMLDFKRKIFRSDNTGDFANYRSEEGEGQAEELLSQIQLDSEGLFELEFWFWILADTPEELSTETDEVLRCFKHGDGAVRIEDLAITEAFLSFLPGIAPSMIGHMVTTSSYLLGLMPLSGDYLHESGILFHSVNDRRVFFDNFSGANFISWP